MEPWIHASDLISLIALVASLGALYKSYLEVGDVKMVRPSMIVFAHDQRGGWPEPSPAKVVLRSLLFGTSERGRIIESLYLAVRHEDERHTFHSWTVRQEGALDTGGGLYVPRSGVLAWHYFLVLPDRPHFRWSAGKYQLQLLARLVGTRGTRVIWKGELQLPPDMELDGQSDSLQVWFNLDPTTGSYVPTVEYRTEP